MDVNKHIQDSTDLKYLIGLEKYVDMDIQNIGINNDIIRKMVSESEGMSIEEFDKEQLEGLSKLKSMIQKRITELKKQ